MPLRKSSSVKIMAAPTAPWTAVATMLSDDVERVELVETVSRVRLTYADVLALWRREDAFAAFYAATLRASPFAAFFWECPPTTTARLGSTPFEHVTIRAPGFRVADPDDFREHLDGCDASAGATSFANLGRDARLVAPCERGPAEAYGHLGAFVRGAAAWQQVALWRTVADALEQTLGERGERPTWLSTEGSGVPWLHVRLDSRPKYYHHAPYRSAEMS
jgi:hypothetical protein